MLKNMSGAANFKSDETTSYEKIESLISKLGDKRIELEREEAFYRKARKDPRKSQSDWNGMDMSRKLLEEEISGLESEIEIIKNES